MTFCAASEEERSTFLSIIEWVTSMCNFDWSSYLSTDNPICAFDLHALCAKTLWHQASPFSTETHTFHIEQKKVWASNFRSTATTLAAILVSLGEI